MAGSRGWTRAAACLAALAVAVTAAGCGNRPDVAAGPGQVTAGAPQAGTAPAQDPSATATGSADPSASGGDGSVQAGAGGRHPSESDVYGIPNPGWSEDNPDPPASGPGAAALDAARDNAEGFFAFFSYGLGDATPVDSYQKALPYADADLAARFTQEMSDLMDGTASTAPWDELIAKGQRFTVVIADEEWADWSHPDSCVLAIQFQGSNKDADGYGPAWVPYRWRYLTMLQSSGWKVHSWSDTAPQGWRPPAD